MNVLAAKARFDKLKFKLDAIVFNQKLLEEAKRELQEGILRT